jgi:hypothetical protein
MANIHLDDAQLKSIISEAILTSLTEERRAAIIKAAIEWLVAPSENGSYYGSRKSPLESAFNSAIADLARKLAAEQLESTEMVDRVRLLITEAAQRALETNREKLVENVANAISKGLVNERY